MSGQKRLSFDTSAVNALADSADCTALLAGIRSGYFTRLTFPSVTEPVATTDVARRNKLFDILNVLRINGECLQAHHIILTQLVQNHSRHGKSNWNLINLRFPECEVAIARRDISEKESEEEREFSAATEARFTQTFADVRPKFEQVFEGGTERPTNGAELLSHLDGEGGAFW